MGNSVNMADKRFKKRHYEISKHLDRIEHHESGTEKEGDHLVQHDKISYDMDEELFEVDYFLLWKATFTPILRVLAVSSLVCLLLTGIKTIL